ncbi:MAG: hypothetical protein WCL08_03845 [Verrucomicrobiota bacterium]
MKTRIRQLFHGITAFPRLVLLAVAVATGALFPSRLQAAPVSAGLPVVFSVAVQAVERKFDPRDDQQWETMSKFSGNPEFKWEVKSAFLKERARAIYVHLFTNGGVLGSTAGTLAKILEAGRAQEATALDILVSPSVFVELQRTISVSKDAVVLFRVSDAQRAQHHLLVTYLGR